MKPLPNSPKSSMQRLRGVLAGALKDGYVSGEKDKKEKSFLEEVVNTIILELETYLVDLESETVDQVCGRIETKLELLQKEKESEEGGGGKSGGSQQVSDENVEAARGAMSEKAEAGDEGFIEAVCQVLNNINKDDKLKDFREFIEVDLRGEDEEEKEKGEEEDDGKKKKSKSEDYIAKIIAQSSKIEKAIAKSAFIENIADRIVEQIDDYFKPVMTLQRVANALGLVALKSMGLILLMHFKTLVLALVLAASNLVLAASNLVLAVSNVVLAISNFVLAVSNFALAAANIVLTIATIILAGSEIILAIANLTLAFVIITVAAVVFSALLIAAAFIFTVAVSTAIAIITLGVALVILAATTALSLMLMVAGLFLSLALFAVAIVFWIVVAGAALILAGALLIIAAVAAAAIIALALIAAMVIVGGIMILAGAAMGVAMGAVALAFMIAIAAIATLVGVIFMVTMMVTMATLAALSIIFSAAMALGVVLMAAVVAFAGLMGAAAVGVIVALISGVVILLLLLFFTIFGGGLAGLYEKLIDAVKEWWEENGDSFGETWETVQEWWEKVKEWWDVIVEWWDKFTSTDGFWTKIKTAWDDIMEMGLVEWFNNQYEENKDDPEFKDSFMGKISGVIKSIQEWWEKIDGFELFHTIKMGLFKVYNWGVEVWNGILSFWDDLVNVAEQVSITLDPLPDWMLKANVTKIDLEAEERQHKLDRENRVREKAEERRKAAAHIRKTRKAQKKAAKEENKDQVQLSEPWQDKNREEGNKELKVVLDGVAQRKAESQAAAPAGKTGSGQPLTPEQVMDNSDITQANAAAIAAGTRDGTAAGIAATKKEDRLVDAEK